ncbi:MAG: hypothetical protein ACJ788_07620 [Ktedonobacteraceae bacterium]
MIRRLFRLLIVAIVVVVLLILFAPTLIRGAGNALISSINNTSAQGIAQLIPHTQDNGADLQIKLDGLQANTSYYVSLDEGQCGGNSLFHLGKISTDDHGSATAMLPLKNIGNTFNNLRKAFQQGLWIDVHQGSDVSGHSVACGQVLSAGNFLVQSGGSPTPTVATSSNSSASVVTPASNPTKVPSGVTNTNTNATSSNTSNHTSATPPPNSSGGFPNTGVAPAGNSSYDNYTYPRKY